MTVHHGCMLDGYSQLYRFTALSIKYSIEYLEISIDLDYKWIVDIDLCLCCSTLIFIKQPYT